MRAGLDFCCHHLWHTDSSARVTFPVTLHVYESHRTSEAPKHLQGDTIFIQAWMSLPRIPSTSWFKNLLSSHKKISSCEERDLEGSCMERLWNWRDTPHAPITWAQACKFQSWAISQARLYGVSKQKSRLMFPPQKESWSLVFMFFYFPVGI